MRKSCIQFQRWLSIAVSKRKPVKKKEHHKASKHYQKWYKSKWWRKIRLYILANDPFCVACLSNNIYEASVVVDHVKPHKGDKLIFNDPDNLQALCKPCHDRKTAYEKRGGYIDYRKKLVDKLQ